MKVIGGSGRGRTSNRPDHQVDGSGVVEIRRSQHVLFGSRYGIVWLIALGLGLSLALFTVAFFRRAMTVMNGEEMSAVIEAATERGETARDVMRSPAMRH